MSRDVFPGSGGAVDLSEYVRTDGTNPIYGDQIVEDSNLYITGSEWTGINPRGLIFLGDAPTLQFRGVSLGGYIEFAEEYDDTQGDSTRGSSVYFSGGKFQVNIWDREATSTSTKAAITFRMTPTGFPKIALYDAVPVERAAAITAPTGGATVDTEARAAINAIRDAIKNIGITQ